MIAAIPRRLGTALGLSFLVAAQSAAVADEPAVLRVYAVAEAQPRIWSLSELHSLPAIEIETSTPFTDGPQRFVGVALQAVLGDIDQDAVLSLRAVNDYVVAIPVAELSPRFPIIAYERNGASMSVRDKGPLWLVYPFDESPVYQNELTYSRSIWQLIEVRVVSEPDGD